ncbi:MAG: iron-siderophore ABC transporter substrate-binding protein [Natronospirillum sp.]
MSITRILIVLCCFAATSAAVAQTFPLTIEHKFGTTVIESQPERVVSLDYNGADNLLALGVQPVAIRYWYGDYPRAVWPWAEEVMTETPAILRGDLNFEQITATNPDVIIAVWSGITVEDYERLSLIAPVVAVPPGVGDYALSWEDQALIAGRAVGREAEAQRQVGILQERLANVAQANPDWDGRTAVVATAWNGELGAYTSADVRPQLLDGLGFTTPEAVDGSVESNAFHVSFSMEDIDLLDADVLLWVSTSDDFRELDAVPARRFLAAHREGREVLIGNLLSSAFSHASLLSLPYAIDRLVPALEAALDGNPDTHNDDRP